MKKILILFLTLSLIGCTSTHSSKQENMDENNIENELTYLPIKENPESALMSESPITPKNIDEYLFREDCIYIDTRSPEQFYTEGHIAGFINIPFYDYIADFNSDSGALFTMTKVTAEDGTIYALGETGSFIANYEEAEQIIKDLFPNDKNILVIATAGVESCYFINLLLQLGYNGYHLYNVGSFTTGMGNDISYIGNPDAKYLVPSFELYDTSITYQFSNLTPIK